MNLSEYVGISVKRLAGCYDKSSFDAAFAAIEHQLKSWNIDDDQRQWFWGEVEKGYKKAPQLRLDDTAASIRLFAFYDHAYKMLAAAAAAAAAQRKSK